MLWRIFFTWFKTISVSVIELQKIRNQVINYKNKIIRFGVPDVFIEHGTPEEQRKECGYDKNTIIQKIKELS